MSKCYLVDLAVYIPFFLLVLHNKEGDPNNAQREELKRDPEWQVSNSLWFHIYAAFCMPELSFSCLFLEIKVHPKTRQHPVWPQKRRLISSRTVTSQQRNCRSKATRAPTAGNASYDSSACEYNWRAKVLGTWGAEGVAEPAHRTEKWGPDLVSS